MIKYDDVPTELFEKISKESLTDGRKIVNFAKMQTLPYGALSGKGKSFNEGNLFSCNALLSWTATWHSKQN